MPSAPGEREDAEPEDGAESEQGRAGGAGERAVGDRVGGERGAAQDGEEADDARDHGDHRRDDQVLIIRPENIALPRRVVAVSARQRRREQVEEEDERDDEEADRPAVLSGGQ